MNSGELISISTCLEAQISQPNLSTQFDVPERGLCSLRTQSFESRTKFDSGIPTSKLT